MLREHWLHIYEKPKLAVTKGDRLFRRELAFNYQHKISAMGWYDTATCNVDVTKADAEEIYQTYVGNRVAVYVDNPLVPVWEGFISRVTIEVNGYAYTRSLENMANKVQVLYTTTAASPNDTMTAVADDLDSQAIYGVKMATYDLGNTYATAVANPNIATRLRDRYLATNSMPLRSVAPSSQRNLRVTIEMQGFYHTLKWDQQQITDTTSDTAFNIYKRMMVSGSAPRWITLNGSPYPGNGNGVFFNDVATPLSFDFNGSFSYPRTKRLGESYWDFLVKVTEAGNGVVDYIFGITPTDPNLGYRTSYYRQANTNVEYITNAYGDGRIYTTAGQLVNGWDVRPDRSIRINDILVGYDIDGANEAYIKSITYNAEQGNVTWTTEDNITLEGVFQLDKITKKTSSNFGANARQDYS